ncbi:hypothetical protein [Undibacterium sp.]|uniref:hypothetical protein n=1 Tax=Undibacterium sp. TaxID=1914977 RepID=UPI0037506B6C
MPRRYLTLSEANATLNRGKSIECFIGACEKDGTPGVRWISISDRNKGICVAVFESADIGNESFLDVYAFGPLDSELEFGDPAKEVCFDEFTEAMSEIEAMFPSSSLKLVNEGMIQDEYLEFLKVDRK